MHCTVFGFLQRNESGGKDKMKTCRHQSLRGINVQCTWSSHSARLLPTRISVQATGFFQDKIFSLCVSLLSCFSVAPREKSETKSEPPRANYVHLNEPFPWVCSAQRWERVQTERSWNGRLRGWVCVCVCVCASERLCSRYGAALSRSVKLEWTPGPRLALIAFLSTSSCCIRVTFPLWRDVPSFIYLFILFSIPAQMHKLHPHSRFTEVVLQDFKSWLNAPAGV